MPRVAAAQTAAEKKSLHASERDTERVEKLRAEYREQISACEVSRLKFVDEAGATLALTRLYGRAAPGQRVVDAVPQNYGSSQTMLGALSVDGVGAPWVIEGAVDGQVFRLWVKEVLGPTLRPGDVVVMDNLQADKVSGIEEEIKGRGARLIYLSPYSPDFNPIEKCWSKIKTYLRQAKAGTIEVLMEAIKQALATITAADACAWFAHCGYTLH
jgi:transposase